MADRFVQMSEDFYTIRGSFKIGGLVDIGTQSSLVRTRAGDFVLLDAYEPDHSVRTELMRLTNQGQDVRAILNLHPFHTIHCKAVHAMFPKAELFGTVRHMSKIPSLPWQGVRTEDPGLHEMFAEDFAFSVPAGVDFVSDDENVHFSSVLARHHKSGVVHVDDTLSYAEMPGVVQWLGLKEIFGFHPTLGRALKREAGAADAFRAWAEALATNWADSRAVCTAHIGVWRAPEGTSEAFADRVRAALQRVGPTLDAHTRKHG